MILLWGVPGEGPLEAVRAALADLGAPVALLDQRLVLRSSIVLVAGADGVVGTLRSGDLSVDLGQITAAYLRPYDTRQIGDIARAGPCSPEWAHALEFDDILWSWADVTGALVLSRPSAMAANGSKPRQAEAIRQHGFSVPETLVTTDPDAAREFWIRHGQVIYKSLSSVRSIVARLSEAHLPRLQQVAWCPTQFQQCVPGVDYRVHVVGLQAFSTEVVSDAVDYRYARKQGGSVETRMVDLPWEVQTRCLRMAAAMELPVAGIDLRRTPDGQWFCFEVNPSPAFTFYDDAEGSIAEAIARLLAA